MAGARVALGLACGVDGGSEASEVPNDRAKARKRAALGLARGVGGGSMAWGVPSDRAMAGTRAALQLACDDVGPYFAEFAAKFRPFFGGEAPLFRVWRSFGEFIFVQKAERKEI